MSSGYPGPTGDQFAGVDPRELEREREAHRIADAYATDLEAQRDELRVEVARLLATGMDMAAHRLAAECMLVECKQSVGYAMRLKIDRLLQGDDTIRRKQEALDAHHARYERWRARVEQLEQALGEYGGHKGTCPCRTGPGRMCDCGLAVLHPDRRGGDR